MTGPDTPAILMPLWFYGRVEQGRLVLHNGWLWFQPGSFLHEGGRVRFEPDPASHSGFAVQPSRFGEVPMIRLRLWPTARSWWPGPPLVAWLDA